jgi:hypothetical protein
MITFEKLGNYGRLGNQLFQIAATYGIAVKNGHNFGFPEGWKYNKYFKYQLPTCKISAAKIYYEPEFKFREVLLGEGDYSLEGYFQSELYFKNIEDSIRGLFKPNAIFNDELITLFITHVLGHGIPCSVHVRRGDYLKLQDYHPTQTIEYYKEAMSMMPKNSKFIFFSDDIEWCKEQFGKEHEYIDGNKDIIDLFLMSFCKNHIIANSSFSWWGAWLNPSKNKKVIAPKNWFGSALAHHDTSLLCPEEWTLI